MICRLALISIAVAAAPAWAEDDGATHAPTPSTFAVADDSSFVPNLQPANHTTDVLALATTNYDRATRATTLDLRGELAVYKGLRLVLRVDNIADHGRPGAGASYQFLSEARHGIASTAYLVYKTEGFTEAEGEVEGLVAFGKTFGPVNGILNLAYGQDFEGNERDGEVAVHAHTAVAERFLVGVAGNFRDALGSNGDKSTGIKRDLFAGVTGSVVVSPVVVTAMAGIAGVELASMSGMKTGPSVTLAVGTGF
jgi:hypothetical protein